MKTHARFPLLPTLSSGLLLAAALGACTSPEPIEEGPAYETASVERGTLTITTEATGEVEPIRRVEVKSKAAGEVLRLFVDVGDDVEPGALLAEIDPRDVQNGFNQAEADLGVAKARMGNSEAERNRSNELLAAGVITPSENEAAQLDYANAQANLVKATTNLELAQLRLNDVRIRAPMAGTILQKNVEEGSVIQSASGNVSGGTTLFVMANLNEMQVRTRVDETDMGQLTAGMTTSVQVEAYRDTNFPGRLDKVEPQAEVIQNVTMFPVIISLPNSTGLLRPGMNAEVEIFIDEARDVLLVPNTAIVQTADVGPAAMALGLDPDALDLGSIMRAGFAGREGGAMAGGFGGGAADGVGAGALRTGNAPSSAGASAAASTGESGGSTPETGNRNGGGRPMTAEALAAGGVNGSGGNGANESGGESGAQDAGSDQAPPTGTAAVQRLRAQAAAGEITQDSMRALLGAMRSMGGGMGGAMPGGGVLGTGMPNQARESRPAVVFVLGDDGLPVPRLVQIGLNDWDRTEVVDGIEMGETLVVVGAAQLRAQQEAWLNQMRARFGGGSSPLPGGRGGRR